MKTKHFIESVKVPRDMTNKSGNGPDDYIEQTMKVRSNSYRMQFVCAYNNFGSIKGDIEEFIGLNPSADAVFSVLQDWINQSNKSPKTVITYFDHIKQYLHFRGIKLNPIDIKHSIKLPVIYREELKPLEKDTFRYILDSCSYHRKMLYLAQSSSGMRIGEITQLRKKHLVMGMDRIMVKLPPRITKTKTGRTTFFSSEVTSMIMRKIGKLKDDDLVFGTSENPLNAKINEIRYLSLLLKKMNISEKYENSNRSTITTHSFRAYFITKFSRKDENFAKILSGQKGYLLQYDRMTDKEKLEIYIKFEPNLLVYSDGENKKEGEEDGVKKIIAEKNEEIEKLNAKHEIAMKKIDELAKIVSKLSEDMWVKENYDWKHAIRT